MKTTLLLIVMLSPLAWGQSRPFEFNGFRLGMQKKELGAMSPAMRPWKPVGMMDARKDEWKLTPAKMTGALPSFPKTGPSYAIRPAISGMTLTFTNNALCSISVEGPTSRAVLPARDWAISAKGLLAAALGEPESESEQLSDLSGEAMLEELRKSGVVGCFWPTAKVLVFRCEDGNAVFGGTITPSFRIGATKP